MPKEYYVTGSVTVDIYVDYSILCADESTIESVKNQIVEDIENETNGRASLIQLDITKLELYSDD